MKRKQFYGINVGSSSILLIFIVLCLVSLAVLSLASSSTDYRLSKKVSDRQHAYYEACNMAEKELQSIDSKLASQINDNRMTKDEFDASYDSEYTYLYEISDLQTLIVSFKPCYFQTEDYHYYQVIRWQTVVKNDIDYDTTLHVMH